MKIEDILIELKTFAQNNHLAHVEPRIVNESANLIVQLFPYKMVAKVALYDVKTEGVKACIEKEIAIANHLKGHGIPCIQPIEDFNPGPYECSNHWFSLWHYEEKMDRSKITSQLLLSHIKELETAMLKYPGNLPVLGVWQRIQQSALNLKKNEEPRCKTLLDLFDVVHQYIMSIEEGALVPSHGDAHVKNLYPAQSNWLWMDFEDASLMPKYWDLASLVANIALFHGLQTPVIQKILMDKDLVDDDKAFFMMLKARVLMSIIGNLDMALQGLGDLEFAELQMSQYEGLFEAIDEMDKG